MPADHIGWYIVPFSIGNSLGPILRGRAFDTIEPRRIIAKTYAVSALLLTFRDLAFQHGWLRAATQTIAWSVMFFFASAAASAAYLTVSETFPPEMRTMAIAAFYAVGTGSLSQVFQSYLLGAALVLAAATVQAVWGTAAERRSLKPISRPLTSIDS